MKPFDGKISPVSQREAPLGTALHVEYGAWVALTLSVCLTLLAWYLSFTAAENRTVERFQYEVDDASARIADRMNDYDQALRGGVALFQTNGQVSRPQWKAYVAALDLQKSLPGIQGFAYSEVVLPENLQAHEAAIRAEGFPEYSVKPTGQRELYTAIVLIEPFDARNQRAFGFDMYSEPTRRAAMNRAIDTGETAISGRVVLKQENGVNEQSGFLMYLPLYHKGMPLATVEQRRQAIRGFVYSPFRMGDLMAGVLGEKSKQLHFVIHDESKEGPEGLMYDSAITMATSEALGLSSSARSQVVDLALQGRTWRVTFSALPDFEKAYGNSLPNLILVLGGVISLVIFKTIGSLVRSRRLVQAKNVALDESQARYAGLVDGLKDKFGFFSVSKHGIVHFISPNLSLMLDVPRLCQGSSIISDLNERGRYQMLAALNDALIAGKSGKFNQEITNTSTGQTAEVEGFVSAVRDAQGLVVSVEGIVEDVTARRKNELELEKYRYQLQEMVDERTSSLEAANQRLQSNELRMKSTVELMQVSDTLTEGEMIKEFLARVIGVLGAEKSFLIQMTPDFLWVQKWILMSDQSDVVHRKFESPGRITLSHEAADVFTQIARNKNILTRNVPQHDLMGTGSQEFLDCKNFTSMASMIVMDRLYVLGLTDKASGFSAYDELQAKLFLEDFARLMVRHESQKALEAAKDEAIAANNAKTSFLANMSHEIRTPLNAIIGLNGILMEELKEPAVLDRLNLINDASRQLLHVLEDVLNYTRIESGSYQSESVSFDILDLFRRTVQSFESKCREKGLRIEQRRDAMLPSVVQGDPTRYKQVLVNLISNAIKFSTKGTITVSLQLDSLSENQATVLTVVEDQGIGIREEDSERILKPFEQSDNSSTRKYGGTGLGLAIASRLCKMMGGQLTFNSKLGEGSRFSFTAQFMLDEKQIQGNKSVRQSDEYSQLKGRHVLVVEDNLLNQQVIKAILTRFGIKSSLVDNGLKAVEFASSNPSVDAILMDVHMPVMNGLDATREIRKLPAPVKLKPIIALTAGTMREDQMACEEAGMNEFLSKPVDVVKLASTLTKYMSPENRLSALH